MDHRRFLKWVILKHLPLKLKVRATGISRTWLVVLKWVIVAINVLVMIIFETCAQLLASLFPNLLSISFCLDVHSVPAQSDRSVFETWVCTIYGH